MYKKTTHSLISLHKRNNNNALDIMKDAANTIQKIESFKLISEHSHTIPNKNNKKQLDRYIMSVVEKSRIKRRHKQLDTLIYQKNAKKTREDNIENSQQPKTTKQMQRQKLNRKVQMLKNRILPLEVSAPVKFQKQLKQIIFINNKREPRPSKQKHQYLRFDQQNSKLYQALNKKYDENQIISNYWSKLQSQQKMSRSAIELIKSNRINLLIKSSITSQQQSKQFNLTKEMLQKQFSPKYHSFHNKNTQKKLQDNSFERTKCSNSFTHSVKSSYQSLSQFKSLQHSSLKKQDQNEKFSIQIINNEITKYLKSKEQKKHFINSINKQFIQKQNAIKVYTFVRGGYSLDSSDLQGQFISLKKFKEAKNDFFTLNQFYKSVKLNTEVRPNDRNAQIDNISADQSFKTLVQVSEMEDKISPHQMLKLMKKSKLVK